MHAVEKQLSVSDSRLNIMNIVFHRQTVVEERLFNRSLIRRFAMRCGLAISLWLLPLAARADLAGSSWFGTWSGQNYCCTGGANGPTVTVSGTWRLDIQSVDLIGGSLTGTLVWQGTENICLPDISGNFTRTALPVNKTVTLSSGNTSVSQDVNNPCQFSLVISPDLNNPGPCDPDYGPRLNFPFLDTSNGQISGNSSFGSNPAEPTTCCVGLTLGTVRGSSTNNSCCATPVVQPLRQNDPRWKMQIYDHSSKRIWDIGCALTSLAMALNTALEKAGLSSDITPASLNDFMKANGDYSGTLVGWDSTTRDIGLLNGKPLTFDTKFWGATSFSSLRSALQHGDHGCPVPVIVGVKLDANGTPAHYVLVTGEQNGQFLIADPAGLHSDLSGYANSFRIRGSVIDPDDMNGFDLTIGNEADFYLINPAGKRTGFDPATGSILGEISNGAYFADSLEDDLTGDPPGEIGHYIRVFEAPRGTFRAVLIGLQSGPYTLTVRRFSRDGSSQPPLVFQGSITAGATNVINIPFDPGADVQSYLLGKGQQFSQNDAGPATLNSSNAFRFFSFVSDTYSNAVTSATLRLPSTTTKTLTTEDHAQYNFGQEFNSKAALDAAFGQGNYVFTIHTRDDGTHTSTLVLPADAYPNTPHIANWEAAQSAQAGSDFTITWDTFVGGNTNDYVQLNIDNTNGNSVFQSRRPLVLGALNGADTSVLIPANTMVAGNSYHAH